MKHPTLSLPRPSLLGGIAVLLTSASAQAVLINFNESNTTAVWSLPSGTNLLSGASTVATPAGNPVTHEGSSSSWSTLTNGLLGAASDKTASVTPNNGNVVTFSLNVTINTAGYILTSFDSYCSWPDSGRDNQNFAVQYSTVAAPTTFITLGVINNQTLNPQLSTHTKLTDDTGILASGVGQIRFIFGSTPAAGQENTWVGYREFVMFGSPLGLTPSLTWTGGSGTGGNSTWISGADSNWKLTAGGGAANFSSTSALTFDSTGTNPNITVDAGGVSAFSLNFTNDLTKSYTFGGGSITTPNGITLSGTGSVTLTAANNIAGDTIVNSGTLNVDHDNALGTSDLLMNGGTVNFLTSGPVLASLTGTTGSVVLGNAAGPINTALTIGSANTNSTFAGAISQASGAVGSLVKTGTGSLILSGVSTYTGTTTVSQGTLTFGKQTALYNNTGASWTNTNIVVESGATLGFRVGGSGEFTSANIDTLKALGTATGGFKSGSSLGLDTTSGNFTYATAIGDTNGGANSIGVTKLGDNALTLSGANTYTGVTKVTVGTLFASNPTGVSLPGNVTLGAGTNGVFLITTADNQFGANSVLTFNNGTHDEKLQLRGTTQTVAGLDSAPTNSLAIIQDDEVGTPGYTTTPALGTLVINASSDHSFYGIIRNQAGQIALTKNGAGTQELRNSTTAVGLSYTGQTTINDGKLLLNLSGANNGFGSNITVNAPGVLGLDGNFNLDRIVSGDGSVVKQGSGTVALNSASNSYSGGTTVTSGTLVLSGGGGEGTGPGQNSSAGAMIPTNVITVASGATLGLNGTASLGNSNLLPEFSPSVVINGGTINAIGTSITFIPNLTLNGATVNVGDGSVAGSFNTSLGLLGTVVVGGSAPSLITTTGSGGNANVSLGANSLAGTTFQVADATGNAAADLTISSVLRDVKTTPSSLTKTGPGTLLLSGNNTYTGGTQVNAGTLSATSTTALGTGNVTVASGATLDLNGLSVGNAITNNGGTVSGASSYSGTQTVGGTSSFSGTIGGTVSVASGGTLKGTGTFTGAVTFENGSTHAPGNSPGIQTLSSGATYNSGSTLDWEFVGNTLAIRGTDFDGVDVTGGDLTVQAGAILALLGSSLDYADTAWDAVRTFAVIDFTSGGTSTGNFDLNTTAAGSFSGQGIWSVANTGGNIELTWTPVPEPSTYAALAGLAVLGLALRRRSKRAATAA